VADVVGWAMAADGSQHSDRDYRPEKLHVGAGSRILIGRRSPKHFVRREGHSRLTSPAPKRALEDPACYV